MGEGFQDLTEREKEALRLLSGGHDIKSIAADLGLSVHTVNERLREARRKLGTSSSRQAARILGDLEHARPNFPGEPNFSGDKESGVVHPALPAASHEHSQPASGRGQSIAWLGGGMLLMSLIIATAVVLFVHQGGQATPPPAPMKIAAAAPSSSESAASARQWLELVDGQHWQESWNTAGAVFRSHITAEQWATTVQPIRPPMGSVSSRILQTVTKATSLPGAPDGQYEILQFMTSFEKKPAAVETVTA